MPVDRRNYADPCGVARALDAVGERWALLVVRELSLGPRRFGQLRTGLPDISPNVLSQRLRELEDAGVVRRYELDPPASSTAYELTERGYALDPILRALGRWGAGQRVTADREMSTVSFLRSLRVLVDPRAPDAVYGLDVGGEAFTLEIAGGVAAVTRGRPAAPLATLGGDVATLRRALLSGRRLDRSSAVAVGGDRHAAARLPTLFRAPPAEHP